MSGKIGENVRSINDAECASACGCVSCAMTSQRFRFHFVLVIVAAIVVAGSTGCQRSPDPATPSRSAVDTASTQQVALVVPPKPIETMNRTERQAFVSVLRDSGQYRCCIDPACTTCLYEEDPRCRCGDAVRSKDPVCGECFRGWKKGSGSVAGIDAKDIRRR